jgi:hypothetical protein
MKTKTKLGLKRETVISLTIQSNVKGGAQNTAECPWQMTDGCPLTW